MFNGFFQLIAIRFGVPVAVALKMLRRGRPRSGTGDHIARNDRSACLCRGSHRAPGPSHAFRNMNVRVANHFDVVVAATQNQPAQ